MLRRVGETFYIVLRVICLHATSSRGHYHIWLLRAPRYASAAIRRDDVYTAKVGDMSLVYLREARHYCFRSHCHADRRYNMLWLLYYRGHTMLVMRHTAGHKQIVVAVSRHIPRATLICTHCYAFSIIPIRYDNIIVTRHCLLRQLLVAATCCCHQQCRHEQYHVSSRRLATYAKTERRRIEMNFSTGVIC